MDVASADTYGTLGVYFEGKKMEVTTCNQTSFYPPKPR